MRTILKNQAAGFPAACALVGRTDCHGGKNTSVRRENTKAYTMFTRNGHAEKIVQNAYKLQKRENKFSYNAIV